MMNFIIKKEKSEAEYAIVKIQDKTKKNYDIGPRLIS